MKPNTRGWLCYAAIVATVAGAPAQAAIKTQLVDYKQGDATLQGYLAYDDSKTEKRAGIVVYHDWNGMTDTVKERARMLAQLGYVAFAADIYGKGVAPKSPAEAGAEAGKYMKDRALLLARAQAGLDVLRKNAMVDQAKLAAVGYCFGAAPALDLARNGADLKSVVSFHGSLRAPEQNPKMIKAKVLALHGADDPLVNQEAVQAFQKEMKEAQVDYAVVLYGGALHSFTDKRANNPAQGVKYDEKADKRSWTAMRDFLRETPGR
jgi:dienelactone hydrolase